MPTTSHPAPRQTTWPPTPCYFCRSNDTMHTRALHDRALQNPYGAGIPQQVAVAKSALGGVREGRT